MISISKIDVLNQNSHVEDRLESLTDIEEACSVKYLSNLHMLKNGKFYSARFTQFNHSNHSNRESSLTSSDLVTIRGMGPSHYTRTNDITLCFAFGSAQ